MVCIFLSSRKVTYFLVILKTHSVLFIDRREYASKNHCPQGFDKIILAFGLCGGAAKNLKAGDTELIMPKVHD
ncbi:MAG: DUF1638 domain-containing protein [Pelosinus sp.]|nr:DUF1638 domain-containing protein [Pelosinus sp.]